jgi:hypothetical protein
MIIPVNWANWITQYTFTGDSEPMITTCGVNVSTWGGDYEGGLEWLSDLWLAALVGSTSDEVTVGPYSLAVGQDGGDPVTYEYDASNAGSEPSFPMWPNTAILVRKGTDLGGRRNRGRMYVPGAAIRSAISVAGVIDSLFLADFNTNLATFLSTVNAGTGFNATELGVLHSEPPSAPAEITSLVAQPKVATQRRRLRP